MSRLAARAIELAMIGVIAAMLAFAIVGPTDNGLAALPVAIFLPVAALVAFEIALAGRSSSAVLWGVLAAAASVLVALPAVAWLAFVDFG